MQTDELIKRVFQKVTGISEQETDMSRSFVSYELDSYLAFELTTILKEIVPELPMTIFLECQSLNEQQLESYFG
jgi:acyl carrier protein